MNCCSQLAAIVISLAVVVSAAADEPRRLTTDGHFKFDPAFLPGGEELLYVLQESTTQTSLMRLKPATGEAARVNPMAGTAEFEPAVSSDGRYLAFIRSRGNLNLELVIRDTTNGSDVIFDPGGGFSSLRHPTISPDNQFVIFGQPDDSGQPLFRVTIAAKERTKLTDGEGYYMWPSYSPDGKKLVCGSSRDGDFELYTMSADGSNLRRLTNRPGREMRPRWSPDGRTLIFTSSSSRNDELYLIDADGNNLRQLTIHPERDDYAAWHADGRHVVAVCERHGQFDLWLLDTTAAAKVPAENR